MGRLAGTGFYIPPEWYNRFRMFPPINHNYQQEKTLNPHNQSEPTSHSVSLDAERAQIRDELARKSRHLASEGMRYYNIFWVKKPLDRMEQDYFELTKKKGVAHAVAIKRVLEAFYDEIAAKKRVAAIQAEEAKRSGKFISMREAVVVMSILSQIQRDQLTPHQASLLAKTQYERVHGRTPQSEAAATDTREDAISPDALASVLAEREEPLEDDVVTPLHTDTDSVAKLHSHGTEAEEDIHWYTGEDLFLDLSADSKE